MVPLIGIIAGFKALVGPGAWIVNIISTSKEVQNIPIIEISGSPKSNDVIGLQDLYLQLDVSNSTVDMIIDNVTPGDNTSGTSYTATSSYANGNIARLTEGEKENTTLLSSDTYVLGATNLELLGESNPTPMNTTSSY